MSSGPREPGTEELADLPVDGLPRDAPERAMAAVDSTPAEPDPDATAHDPDADRSPKVVATAYANALASGEAATAAGLFAESGAVYTATAQHIGRAAVASFHDDLLAGGAVTATPGGQATDTARTELAGGGVVELAFDASGRIGSARWLDQASAALPHEE